MSAAHGPVGATHAAAGAFVRAADASLLPDSAAHDDDAATRPAVDVTLRRARAPLHGASAWYRADGARGPAGAASTPAAGASPSAVDTTLASVAPTPIALRQSNGGGGTTRRAGTSPITSNVMALSGIRATVAGDSAPQLVAITTHETVIVSRQPVGVVVHAARATITTGFTTRGARAPAAVAELVPILSSMGDHCVAVEGVSPSDSQPVQPCWRTVPVGGTRSWISVREERFWSFRGGFRGGSGRGEGRATRRCGCRGECPDGGSALVIPQTRAPPVRAGIPYPAHGAGYAPWTAIPARAPRSRDDKCSRDDTSSVDDNCSPDDSFLRRRDELVQCYCHLRACGSAHRT